MGRGRDLGQRTGTGVEPNRLLTGHRRRSRTGRLDTLRPCLDRVLRDASPSASHVEITNLAYGNRGVRDGTLFLHNRVYPRRS